MDSLTHKPNGGLAVVGGNIVHVSEFGRQNKDQTKGFFYLGRDGLPEGPRWT